MFASSSEATDASLHWIKQEFVFALEDYTAPKKSSGLLEAVGYYLLSGQLPHFILTAQINTAQS